MEFLKKRQQKILAFFLYAVFCLISYFSNIGCIWKYIFRIPCPGCGFTRAVLAAIRLDFAAALSYHPMFWSFPIIAWMFVFDERINKKVFVAIASALLIAFFAVWIIRIFAR